MDRATKLKTVRFVRDELQGLDWEDQSLHLTTFGFSSPEHMTVQDCLLEGDETGLQELASYLRGEQDEADLVAGPISQQTAPLKVFASHLAAHRSVVSTYAAEFQKYGIELFVAHDSIEPDAVWADEIVRSLRTAHCGIVFLHDGFNASGWCDQEAGWLLGRGVPVPVLKFEATPPYGPLGFKQAINVAGRYPEPVVVETLNILRNSPAIASNLVESLVVGLERSPNFHTTDLIWDQLEGFRELTTDQTERVMQAAAGNSQVRNASCPEDALGRTYPVVLQEFVESQASYSAPMVAAAAWGTAQAPF
jgi:hypothetical protein